VTETEKASILQVVYAYTERFEGVETIDDLVLLDSLILRWTELGNQIRDEDQQYAETLLLLNKLGEVDGSSGN
jgi:hypothetical protein